MENEIEMIKKQNIRMAFVRTIQNSFYKSASLSSSIEALTDDLVELSSNQYDGSSNRKPNSNNNNNHVPTMQNGGTIDRLSLWCVPWTEVIGRSNVLFVHDAIYTNMFEELIRRSSSNLVGYDTGTGTNATSIGEQQQPGQNDPILFGHVSVQDTSKKSTIQSWQDYAENLPETPTIRSINQWVIDSTFATPTTSSTDVIPIGTIMRINDYRRMNDGKLILYVQAIERFAITKVHQQIPYRIAQVQLLPDIEEITSIGCIYGNSAHEDTTGATTTTTEDIVRPLRSQAIVTESWNKWFQYEYSSNVRIPLSSSSLSPSSTTTVTTISMSDVVGCELAKVVPFVPFNPNTLSRVFASYSNEHHLYEKGDIDRERTKVSDPLSPTSPPIEIQLLQSGIFLEEEMNEVIPSSIRNIDTLDELEYRLWVVLNEYYIKSNTSISPFILSILPALGTFTTPWPKGFLLEGIASVMQRTTTSGSNINSKKIHTIGHANINRNSNSTHGEETYGTSSSTVATKVQASSTSTSTSYEFVRVSMDYPSIRRQKRLSYYSGQTLESIQNSVENVQAIRQILLRLPSIKLRLSFILSKLENELFKIKLQKVNNK